MRETHRPEQFVPRLEVDHELTIAECDLDLIEWLERMAPHGLDNPEPLYQLLGAKVKDVMTVGGNKHLRMTVIDATGEAEAIGFGMGARASSIRQAGRADLVFIPSRNEWKGDTRVQLKLKDVRLS